eukprot:TRINITY_DN44480_c0_g1_i1.p1 TRINITY_DN44480_c0_g1~~TRINITY_DN44480_c0_g1_i1.p1  ORF type:complete len:357 (+),score=109.53 TRINITY_DN44480_c0_g1_i1:49-1071(+)
MPQVRVRVRGPQSQSTLEYDDSISVQEFLGRVRAATGLEGGLELRGGYPPRVLQLPVDPTTRVSELPIRSGDSLTVNAAAAPPAPPAPAPAPSPAAPPATAPAATAPAAAPAAQPSVTAAPADSGEGWASAPVGDEGMMLRRIIPSDNSCLFHAVSYVAERAQDVAGKLREVVAAAIAADPVQYTSGILGKEPEEYCRWVRQPQSWGGQVELTILAQHYGVEISAHDIQTCRSDVYGAGAPDRVFVLYDGLHYDALALSPGEGLPAEFDQTRFSVADGARLQRVVAAAEAITAAANRKRKFTDTANFTLRCLVCQAGVRGQDDAVRHSKQTGHASFAEYS